MKIYYNTHCKLQLQHTSKNMQVLEKNATAVCVQEVQHEELCERIKCGKWKKV